MGGVWGKDLDLEPYLKIYSDPEYVPYMKFIILGWIIDIL